MSLSKMPFASTLPRTRLQMERLRTPRTLQEAFGPTARLSTAPRFHLGDALVGAAFYLTTVGLIVWLLVDTIGECVR